MTETASEMSVTLSAGSLCNEVNVYEYYNSTTVDHLHLTVDVPNFGPYVNQGVLGKICQTNIEGTVALHRYWAGAPFTDTMYLTTYLPGGYGPFCLRQCSRLHLRRRGSETNRRANSNPCLLPRRYGN